VSTASEPELVKKTRVIPSGAIAATRSARVRVAGIAELECGRVVEGLRLARDRLDDPGVSVPARRAPQAGQAVEQAPPSLVV
jgi:hypothetical protein